jgi:chemotaxis protein methyltransferase CheR
MTRDSTPTQNTDFELFFKMLEGHTGIAMSNEKEYLLAPRLSSIAQKNGFTDHVSLIKELVSKPICPLHWVTFEAMATHETMFFRDTHPFQAIKDVLLPQLIHAKRDSNQLSIWCAAASTGQEPYSMAMLLRESFPNLSDWDVKIHATDLSERALSQARSGIYSRSEMQRGLTKEQISRHFTRLESGHYQVNSDLRKMIQFENINLIKPWQVLPKSDLILMRNILIYFNQEKKQMVLSKMRDQLSDAGGYLMLGASESILFDASFKLHRLERVSYYSKA